MGDTKSSYENGQGTRWRCLAGSGSKVIEFENQGTLDEFVLDDWLHLEHMDGHQWWMRVGDARLWISIDGDKVQVDVERGCYAEVSGETITAVEANPPDSGEKS